MWVDLRWARSAPIAELRRRFAKGEHVLTEDFECKVLAMQACAPEQNDHDWNQPVALRAPRSLSSAATQPARTDQNYSAVARVLSRPRSSARIASASVATTTHMMLRRSA